MCTDQVLGIISLEMCAAKQLVVARERITHMQWHIYQLVRICFTFIPGSGCLYYSLMLTFTFFMVVERINLDLADNELLRAFKLYY